MAANESSRVGTAVLPKAVRPLKTTLEPELASHCYKESVTYASPGKQIIISEALKCDG